MKHVMSAVAILFLSSLALAGCATSHLNGQYNPDNQVTLDKPHEIDKGRSELSTIAVGHDWVFFWGLLEFQSTDFASKIKPKVAPNQLIEETQIRNHLSLPGALLWIVTAGIVSHHDVDFRGRIVTAKEIPPPVAPAPTAAEKPAAAPPSERELLGEATIDRPMADIERDFRDAATRSGLVTVAAVHWNDLSMEKREATSGEIPENRLEGVPLSNIESFCVTTDSMARDVRSDAKCGTYCPCIVIFEKDGKTRVLYSKGTAHLRYLDSLGQVGEGKIMSRAAYDDHMFTAVDYEKRCDDLVRNLKASPKTP